MIASGKWLLLISKYSPVKVVVRKCSWDKNSLTPKISHVLRSEFQITPWRQNMVNMRLQHLTPSAIPTQLTMKLTALHPLLPFHKWQRSLNLFPFFSYEYITLRHNLNILEIHMQKCLHIAYTTIFLWILFLSSAINIKLLSLCVLGTFQQFSRIGLLWLIHREIHLSRHPFLKQSVIGMVPILWYQLFSILFYWGIRKTL